MFIGFWILFYTGTTWCSAFRQNIFNVCYRTYHLPGVQTNMAVGLSSWDPAPTSTKEYVNTNIRTIGCDRIYFLSQNSYGINPSKKF